MPANLTVKRPSDFIDFLKEDVCQGIHQRIEKQAQLYPDHEAIKTPEAAYTYREMNSRANSLAEGILTVAGSGLEHAAILLATNSPEMILSILASLKAHKAYVPLDPKLPFERLGAILDDVEPVVLLTDEPHLAQADRISRGRIPIVNLSRHVCDPAAPNPDVRCDPMDRAYILYTSGTTGTPKGIEFLHRNLVHHIRCMTNRLFFAPSDKVTWLHSASFSASVVDIYSCLMNGATLYPWDVKTRGFIGMADWLVAQRITTLQWIPSAFRQFLRTVPEHRVFEDVRIVVMASEPLTTREVDLFRRHFPFGSHLVNQVGTSESYNYRLYAVDHLIPIESANVAAGYAVSDEREVLILDDDRQVLAAGTEGEIGIRSRYMSAGYWKNAELTQSKFVRVGGDDTPVYLTGDMGWIEADGCLIHLGRKDTQVKLRGYRVELAEIDHALSHCKEVADSVTRLANNPAGDHQLVSYILASKTVEFDRKHVESEIKAKLPDYMIPAQFVILDSFPVLPNGKIDYEKLPNPFETGGTTNRYGRCGLTPSCDAITTLFSEVLGISSVGEDTDFLREGGDSLSTAVLLHQVHELWGVAVSVDRFLLSPTPQGLAALVAERQKGERLWSHAVLAQQKGSGAEAGVQARVALMRTRRTHALGSAPGIEVTRDNHQHASTASLVIIGAGGLGRETYTWATQAIAAGASWRIKGFLDKRPDALNGWCDRVKVLGDPENYEIEDGDVFVGAVGDPVMKVNCYSPILERGGRFVNVIHPLSNIGIHVKLGLGIVAGPFSSITCDVRVGDYVSLGALSNLGHDTTVGDWCHISSHCGVNGKANLDDGVFLGSHACIAPSTSVGAWSFVGAGSVVVRNVPPDTKVFGSPAVPIGRVQSRHEVM